MNIEYKYILWIQLKGKVVQVFGTNFSDAETSAEIIGRQNQAVFEPDAMVCLAYATDGRAFAAVKYDEETGFYPVCPESSIDVSAIDDSTLTPILGKNRKCVDIRNIVLDLGDVQYEGDYLVVPASFENKKHFSPVRFTVWYRVEGKHFPVSEAIKTIDFQLPSGFCRWTEFAGDEETATLASLRKTARESMEEYYQDLVDTPNERNFDLANMNAGSYSHLGLISREEYDDFLYNKLFPLYSKAKEGRK